MGHLLLARQGEGIPTSPHERITVATIRLPSYRDAASNFAERPQSQIA